MDIKDFHTFSEYMKKEDNALTASMEDYLEMIYRLSLNTGFTRIHELSEALHIQPPSATKMVQRLSEIKLLKYEKYGVLILEEEGKLMGEMLLKRHNTIEEFLRILDIPELNILMETEKIEHTLSSETVKRFGEFISFLMENREIIEKFRLYREKDKC
jgi:Mn-dependent DtxR family transcriptional regulator